jgi:hypothetical protein
VSVQTSSIPAAWNYLVATAKTKFASSVLVCDGPMPVVDLEDFQDRVTIGWDGSPESYTDAVDGEQDFNALNRAVSRDENYSIVCSVTHWDGNNDVSGARTAAFALLATFEQILRGVPPNGTGDATLGGAVLFAGIGGGIQAWPALTDKGAAFTIVFHVKCRARLTGS